MSENKVVAEEHGCIVCGKIYSTLVVYSPSGQLIDFTITSAGGQKVPDARRVLVACASHPPEKVQAAYHSRYPGAPQPEDEEHEDK